MILKYNWRPGVLGREPILGETLCDGDREAVMRRAVTKDDLIDGGQHNNIGTAAHAGLRVECARDGISGHLVAASARTHLQPIFAREPICQSLRHSRPPLIGEVRDKRCQNVHPLVSTMEALSIQASDL
jgi:hypothetical protein